MNWPISDWPIQVFQARIGKLESFDTATDETAFRSTNRNVEKTSHLKSASARGGFRRARLVHGMARLRLSRLSDNLCLALRAGGSVCGYTLTGASEPKTWLVRLLRRDCWPEMFYGFSSYIPLDERKLEY
jgi:hypothetical protein